MEFPSPKNTTKKSEELFQIHEIHTQPFELKIEAHITKTNDSFFFLGNYKQNKLHQNNAETGYWTFAFGNYYFYRMVLLFLKVTVKISPKMHY